MSQEVFSSINPSTTSGTQLATILNNFKDAVISGMSGTSRPTEIDAGGMWVDTLANPIWYLKLFNGTSDVILISLNATTGIISSQEIGNSISVTNNDDSAVGPIINLLKKRLTGDQSLLGDLAGQVDFKGTTDAGLGEVVARIVTTLTENTTATAQGSKMSFWTNQKNTPNLTERMTITDEGKVGIGITAPTEVLEVVGNVKTSGKVLVEDTTESTNISTGSVIIKGGVGIVKDVYVGGDVVIAGTLTVPTINSVTDLEVVDREITINKGGTQISADSGSGLRVEITDGTDALIRYNDASPNKWDVGEVGSLKPVASTTGSEIFTNKTVDADLNTITNLENENIKAGAGIAESKLSLDHSTTSLYSHATVMAIVLG